MPKPLQTVRKRRVQRTAQSIQTKRRYKALKVIGLIITTCILLFVMQKYARIQTIVCQITTQEKQFSCDPSITQKIQHLRYTPIIFYNHHEAISTALAAEPVRINTVKKYFPRTLHITLTQEHIVYYLQSDGESYAVTQSGAYFASAASQDNTPRISITNTSIEEILTHHHQLERLIKYAHQRSLQVSHITWSHPDQIILELSNAPIRPIIRIHTWQKDLALAETILFAPEFEDYLNEDYYIDVRFALPVLRETL